MKQPSVIHEPKHRGNLVLFKMKQVGGFLVQCKQVTMKVLHGSTVVSITGIFKDKNTFKFSSTKENIEMFIGALIKPVHKFLLICDVIYAVKKK